MKLSLLCLIASIVGLLMLFFISNSIQPEEIGSYNQLKLNKFVQTYGKIVYSKTYDDFSIIRLDNNLTVTCNCLFRVNQTIIVEGKVTSYKNELQIEATRIEEY